MVSRKVRGATAVTLAALVGALGGMPAVSWADTLAKTDAAKTEQAAATEAATTQAATTEAKSGDQVALASETAPDSQEGKAAATNGKFYDTVQEAIDAAETDGTVWVYGNTDENVTVSKKVSITGVGDATEQAFSGTITFVAGSEGSVVSNVHFTYPVAEGTHNAVVINGTSDITVSDNTFDAPSALLKGKEWQRNGVWVQSAKSVSINQNKFNLGRLNDTNGSGDVAADSNSNAAVNLVGGGDGNVSDVRVTNNILAVTAPDGTATRDASVNLLIANGNSKDGQYGVKDVTVENNTYNGSADAANANTRFAGISNVSGITFTKNTVSYAARGVAQSVWQGNTSQNDGVTVGEGNTFSNVASPFEAKTVPSEDQQTGNGAFVTKADGTFAAYGWVSDAVNAINDGDDSFAGATLTINKNLYNHQEFTFNKKVTVTTTPGSDFTFNGSIRLNASGSVVKGVHFVYDADSTYRANLIVSDATDDVQVTGNTFTVKDAVKGQPNAVWLEGSAKNTVVDGNAFYLGNGDGISVVGVALTAWSGGDSMSGTKVTNNKVTMTGDYKSDTSAESFNLFVKAYGARDTAKGQFGIEDLTVSGNTFDSKQPAGVGNFLGLSNVKGLTLTNNDVSNTTYGVFNVNYQGKTNPNTGLTVSGNTFTNVTYTVRPQVTDFKNADGNITPGITYTDGFVKTKATDVSGFRGDTYKAPEAPNAMTFAGWYSDESLATPLDANTMTGEAYAKFVPVSTIISYKGGSLRMDYASDYSKASLRFGYDVKMPAGSTQSYDESGWYWDTDISDGQLNHKTAVKNYADNSDGSVVTNLVFTGIQAKNYTNDLYVKSFVTYTTADGTKVTVNDGSIRSYSVQSLAQVIQASDSASADEKAYAGNLLAQIGTQAE